MVGCVSCVGRYLVIKDIPESAPTVRKYYGVGKQIPLYRTYRGNLVWHVWTTMEVVPDECVELVSSAW